MRSGRRKSNRARAKKFRARGVPAKTLTKQGYAVCLFPEQPEIRFAAERPSPTGLVRERFNNRLCYIITFAAFSVSINNVILFPLHVFRYGPVFLVAYTFFTFIVGWPLHALESSMGQFAQRGLIRVWDCCPIMQGVGYSMLIACIMFASYNNMFAVYATIYMARMWYRSDVLPWRYCSEILEENSACVATRCADLNMTHAAKHFFYANILNTKNLRRPPDAYVVGHLKYYLILSFAFIWIIIYISTLKSVRTIEKVGIMMLLVIYFCYITLLLVFLQMQTSRTGRVYYFDQSETLSLVFYVEIFTRACVQVILELGACFGVPIVFASFCHFRSPVYTNSIMICALNYLHSILFLILFALALGTLQCSNYDIGPSLFTDSLGIVFIVFTEVVVSITNSRVWSGIFFVMIFCVAVSTQIALFETITVTLYEYFIYLSKIRWLINIFLCAAFFLLGLLYCTENGFYMLNMLHTMPIFLAALPICFLFLFGLIVPYGMSKYKENLHIMTGTGHPFLRGPISVLLLVILLMSIMNFINSVPLYSMQYPQIFLTVGWSLLGVIFAPVVIWFLIWFVYSSIKNKSVDYINYSTERWVRHEEILKGLPGPAGTGAEHMGCVWYWRRKKHEAVFVKYQDL